MLKNNLLSIGEVSKLTGVHVKSLRYYEQIGVLKPAYVDPDTNYRYYTYLQLDIVYTLQMCIELDIPLKKYLEFTGDDGQSLYAEQLFEYGKIQTQKKIRALKQNLKQIDSLQKDLTHSKLFSTLNQLITYEPSQKYYYILPLKSKLIKERYGTLSQICSEVTKQGYEMSSEYGLLYFYNEQKVDRYQFIEVKSTFKRKHSNIITVPSMEFMAKSMSESTIESAPLEFPELFTNPEPKIVIETELLTQKLDINHPIFELRCALFRHNYKPTSSS